MKPIPSRIINNKMHVTVEGSDHTILTDRTCCHAFKKSLQLSGPFGSENFNHICVCPHASEKSVIINLLIL